MSQEHIKAWWFDRMSDLVAQNIQLMQTLAERDRRRTRRQNGAHPQQEEPEHEHDQAPHDAQRPAA